MDPLTGSIGAKVTGIDLAACRSGSLLWELLCTHKVLFFPGQNLTHAEHIRLGRLFGELTRRPAPHSGPSPDGYPEVLVIDSKERDPRFGVDFEEHYRARWLRYTAGWHTDLTPAVNPPSACILRCETNPPVGGETTWTNLVAAYQGLSLPLRSMADELMAEHSFFAGCQMHSHDKIDEHVLRLNREHSLVSVHPVVRVNEDTRERALFVNPASTRRITGMTPGESRAVLEILFDQVIRPEYTVRWRWKPGDVAFWDNRATAHLQALDIGKDSGPRRLYRVTILGQTPTGPKGQVSTSIAGEPFKPLVSTVEQCSK